MITDIEKAVSLISQVINHSSRTDKHPGTGLTARSKKDEDNALILLSISYHGKT